jgi:hypothetical protein
MSKYRANNNLVLVERLHGKNAGVRYLHKIGCDCPKQLQIMVLGFYPNELAAQVRYEVNNLYGTVISKCVPDKLKIGK